MYSFHLSDLRPFGMNKKKQKINLLSIILGKLVIQEDAVTKHGHSPFLRSILNSKNRCLFILEQHMEVLNYLEKSKSTS